ALVVVLVTTTSFAWMLNQVVLGSRSDREHEPAGRSDAAFAPQDYSQFKHDNPQHARLPCLLCHRRESNSARPSLPGKSNHAPCTGCHARQFSDSTSPICTICHTNVQAGTVKPFLRLKSFNLKFDHA